MADGEEDSDPVLREAIIHVNKLFNDTSLRQVNAFMRACSQPGFEHIKERTRCNLIESLRTILRNRMPGMTAIQAQQLATKGMLELLTDKMMLRISAIKYHPDDLALLNSIIEREECQTAVEARKLLKLQIDEIYLSYAAWQRVLELTGFPNAQQWCESLIRRSKGDPHCR